MKFVIKLFPEITIKSKPVRKRFVVQLRRNIKDVLQAASIKCNVQGLWDAIEVIITDDDREEHAISCLTRIPGIAKVLTVKEHSFETFDDILEITKDIFIPQIEGKSFCVRVKRTGDHSFKSVDVERYIGGGLLKYSQNARVDLYNPEYTVRMEIRKQRLHTISAIHDGLGGYPLGCQDSVLSLISGGFDSNVASYLMNRRGLRTHFLFFNLGGTAHEVGVKQVSHYLWSTFGSSHSVKFVTIPFEDVVAEILQNVDNSQMGVILKRMMLRAASQIAEELNIEALVTGESIAQVSSQTLRNLTVIDSVTDTLVLRPLVTMDKPEIVDISRKIGTYEYAATMPEFCGVISVKPTTRAKIEKVEHEESKFDFSVLDKAIENRVIEKIQNVLSSTQSVMDVELVSIPAASDVIIDIRPPLEEERKPLLLTNNVVKKIPFFELGKAKADFESDQNYLLYCEKGTMSQMHAQQLNQEGMVNIKVFKPDA